MKKIIILVIILFALIGGVAYTMNMKTLPNFAPFVKSQTCTIDGVTFNLYAASNSKDQQIGLSKYSKIDQNMGMIFLFNRSDYYSFWMKDMKFPIDIIFINNNNIVAIFKNVQPPSSISNNQILPIYTPSQVANTVLEINAGLSDKYNFKVNDTVKITNI